MKPNQKPSKEVLWEAAVEMWFSYIDRRWVEKIFQDAIRFNTTEESIEYLQKNIGLIGIFGKGEPGGLKIDVGGDAGAPDLLKVYWGTWDNKDKQFNITAVEIFSYLRNGKKLAVQLDLL